MRHHWLDLLYILSDSAGNIHFRSSSINKISTSLLFCVIVFYCKTITTKVSEKDDIFIVRIINHHDDVKKKVESSPLESITFSLLTLFCLCNGKNHLISSSSSTIRLRSSAEYNDNRNHKMKLKKEKKGREKTFKISLNSIFHDFYV